MLGIRGLFALLVAVVGVVGTFLASETLRDEARQNWQLEATKTAGALSGTLLNWLEESYAPISGLAALVENSDNVTESEFLNGFDSLEARATAFFLEAAALAEPAVEKEGDWSIRYSTDFEGALSPETPLADHPEVLEAIRVAKDRFGEIILARPIKSSRTGATVSPVALGTFSKTEELALVGLVDYRELVQGLYDLLVPEGAAVRITGRFPEQGGPGPERDIIAGRIDRPRFSVPTRTVSAGAELKITWDFDDRFSGGPDQELANLTMISGLIGSAVLSLFLAFLLHQNKTIMQRVDAATRELSQKEAQLRLALEHMPGAMWVVDKDLKLVFANDQYKDFYGDSGGIVRPGTPMEEIIKQEASSGLLSGGEVDAVIEERMASYRSSEPSTFEDRTQRGGHIQLSRKPATDGNVVSVAMDITELKESERQIETQRAQLDDVMRNIHQAVIMFDRNQRVITFNARLPEVLGLDAGFFAPGMALFDLARNMAERGFYGDGDIDQLARERVDKLWAGETRGELTFDGVHVFDVHGTRTPDGGLLVTYSDITERKNWERQIEAQRAQLDGIMNSIHQGVVLFDENQKLAAWNARYPDTLNIDKDFFEPGLSLYDIARFIADRGDYGPGDPDEMARERVEKIWVGESRSDLSFGDGRIFDAHSFRTPDGGLIVTYTDITDRKEAERQIESQRAQLDNILRNIQQGVVLCDNDRRVIAWNPRFPDILNVEEEMLEGGALAQDVVRLIAERGIYGEGDLDALAKERIDKMWQGETRADLSFGDERSFEVHSTPLPDGGLIATYMDITERKNAERIIADAMKLINESIQYASRIQRSVLPSEDELKSVFADHLVVWEPKDVVGGDIYLIRKCLGGTLLFVADCTGHGVPGAFMTMIATGSFDQALIENPGGDPAELLKRTNQLVKATLGQQEGFEGESDDGLECGVCLIDHWQEKLTYAGARFELWVIEDGTMDVVKGDRTGIGFRHVPGDRSFSDHTVVLGEDTALYMFSDGITDQIGGPKRRSFGKRRMKSILMDYHKMPMERQVAHLMRELGDYQHGEERRDDITLLGFVPMIVP